MNPSIVLDIAALPPTPRIDLSPLLGGLLCLGIAAAGVFGIVALALVVIVRIRGGASPSIGGLIPYAQRREQPGLVYWSRGTLLSRGEMAFFEVLRHVAADDFMISAKVRLPDLVDPAPGHGRQSRFGRISQKHVDFVLCDPDSSAIQLAIELDDRSHQAPYREERDQLVDEVLRAAGIPILRVTARQAYDVLALRQAIHDAMA